MLLFWAIKFTVRSVFNTAAHKRLGSKHIYRVLGCATTLKFKYIVWHPDDRKTPTA
jgi:hypothetical protein